MERAELVKALAPLVTAITELGETVQLVAEEQAARDAQRAEDLAVRAKEGREAERRQVRRTRWIGAAVVLLLIFVGGLGYVAFTNRTVLNKVEAVTGPDAQARQAAGTRDILARNAVETDCRHRRAQARLPAPAVAPAPPAGLKPAELAAYFAHYSCVNQTPPEVYPGIEGVPPR